MRSFSNIFTLFLILLSFVAEAQWMRTSVDRTTYLKGSTYIDSPALLRLEKGRDILTLPLDSAETYIRTWDYISGKRGYVYKNDITLIDTLAKATLEDTTNKRSENRDGASVRVENETGESIIVEIDLIPYPLKAYEAVRLSLKKGEHGFWAYRDGALPFWGNIVLHDSSENILKIEETEDVIIADIEPIFHQRDTVVVEQHHNEVIQVAKLLKVDSTKIVDNKHPQDLEKATTLLGIRGYVKLNGLYDFNGLTGVGGFAPYNIPVGDASNKQPGFHLDARQSRIGMSSRIKTKEGFIRFYVEGDFAGGGTGINYMRLRHAYVSYGYLTVGQTWSTFNDLATTPLTVDNEGPSTGSSTRQGLIRYEKKIGNTENEFGVSIETPTRTFTDSIAIDRRQKYPDFAGRYKFVLRHSSLQIASILRFISSYNMNEDIVTKPGFGMMVSGKVNLNLYNKNNHIYWQALGGKGITRYVSAFSNYQLDAVPNPNGELYIPLSMGGYIALEHYFTKKFMMNIVSGFSWIDNADFQPGETFEKSYYNSLNGFWFPFDRMRVGGSYVQGQRFNKDGQKGHAQRFQFYVRYDI
ncbi:DcaP family trimeric outer membrane transporter [Flammeovirga sp. SubArs3]|uniref:DcaP family trimeric outer membrane transporter n=1 Tax=Flammeovirga sp. SubArs3 TaxID=2995316 RepID=UPI00248B42ED|nr:DcaP family trimeric outer membrane transporter [Flammeovirga sp. SubArs3]